jgi:hypothetical protein
MKISFRAITLMVLTLVSVSAYAQKVTYDWDKDVDFSPYRTYKWVEVPSGRAPAQTTHDRIRTNVDLQLQAKSLKKTEDAHADLYVSYQVITDANGKITSFNPDGQWQPGPGMSGGESKPQVGNMVKGNLIIDLYDQKMKKLVWRGAVSGDLDSRQTVIYTINKGLSKLFRYFPPPPTK